MRFKHLANQRPGYVFSREPEKQLNIGLTFIRWREAELQRDADVVLALPNVHIIRFFPLC